MINCVVILLKGSSHLRSYSSHNKIMHIKVWFIVICCCTTGAVSIKVMEDYSISSFLLGFKCFASTAGYPKMLLPYEGSQLINGCSNMKLNIRNIRNTLSTEYGVEFETCPVGGHIVWKGKSDICRNQLRKA